jgi:hypothetical protein
LGVSLALSMIADLGVAAYAQKRGNRERASEAKEAAAQGLLEKEGLLVPGAAPPRVFLPTYRENAGMERGWSTPYGYSALALERVWNHMHGVLGVRPPVSANTFPSLALDRHGPFPYSSMALVAGEAQRTGTLVINRAPDPRAYLTPSVRMVPDFVQATALMRRGHDFHSVALVEGPVELPHEPGNLLASEQEQGRAAIVHFAPEKIEITTKSTLPALLVLAEPWFPGWTARVNGVLEPCIPANAWMRAVVVPAGRSEVVMTFRSTYLLWGLLISLVALVVVLGLLIFPRPSYAWIRTME